MKMKVIEGGKPREDQVAKPGNWTIKGVPMEDRALMNGAAQRAQMTLGAWLVETTRLRIADERTSRLPSAPTAREALSAASSLPNLLDLAALMQGMPALAQAPRCGRVAARARKVLMAGLEAYLMPDHEIAAPIAAAPGAANAWPQVEQQE